MNPKRFWFFPGRKAIKASSAFWSLGRWAVGLGLLWLLGASLDLPAFTSALRRTHWPLAFPALVGLEVAVLLPALAWWELMRACGLSTNAWPFFRALRVFLVATALGNLTPLNAGSDAYRAYASRGQLGGVRQALVPVFLQRWTSSLVLLLLACGGAYLVPLPALGRWALLASAGLFLGGGLFALWALKGGFPQLLPKLGLQPLSAEGLGRALRVGFALGLAFHVVTVGFNALLAQALGVQAAWGSLLAVLLLSRAAALLPLSVAGLGFLEGSLALLFPLVGSSKELGAATALLSRLTWLANILLGALLWLGEGKGGRSEEKSPF